MRERDLAFMVSLPSPIHAHAPPQPLTDKPRGKLLKFEIPFPNKLDCDRQVNEMNTPQIKMQQYTCISTNLSTIMYNKANEVSGLYFIVGIKQAACLQCTNPWWWWCYRNALWQEHTWHCKSAGEIQSGYTLSLNAERLAELFKRVESILLIYEWYNVAFLPQKKNNWLVVKHAALVNCRPWNACCTDPCWVE